MFVGVFYCLFSLMRHSVFEVSSSRTQESFSLALNEQIRVSNNRIWHVSIDVNPAVRLLTGMRRPVSCTIFLQREALDFDQFQKWAAQTPAVQALLQGAFPTDSHFSLATSPRQAS